MRKCHCHESRVTKVFPQGQNNDTLSVPPAFLAIGKNIQLSSLCSLFKPIASVRHCNEIQSSTLWVQVGWRHTNPFLFLMHVWHLISLSFCLTQELNLGFVSRTVDHCGNLNTTQELRDQVTHWWTNMLTTKSHTLTLKCGCTTTDF